ncbi:ABC transporter substrate binding protein [Achromobacter marplatensis]|uniref:ABC transporter substrate binding protein n=1 Tax=Achromobacter marplatensis TaxID=470868 RepID=UPI0039F66CD4
MKQQLCLLLSALLVAAPLSRASAASPPGGGAARARALASLAAGATAASALTQRPQSKPDGERWRIGYVQSGDYAEYPRTLIAVVKGLQELGWLSISDIPSDLSGQETWAYVAEHAHSDTLTFVADASWQPGNFDAAARPALRQAMQDRLTRTRDIDLMIAMGTWAGQDIASLGPPVPTIVGSVSDPIGAGIVASAADSGRQNLHARVQPEKYEQQLRLFHDTVPFKTIGVVYEDSVEGRGYAALGALDRVAAERGFRVVPCLARTTDVSSAFAQLSVFTCYKRLAATVEAVYVTASAGLTAETTRRVATLLRTHRTPSFAMLGTDDVRKGLLFSMARADYAAVGFFHAATIARIFHGELPQKISQIWSDPARIALNLKTMRQVGLDPPMSLLLAADDIFEQDDPPQRRSSTKD